MTIRIALVGSEAWRTNCSSLTADLVAMGVLVEQLGTMPVQSDVDLLLLDGSDDGLDEQLTRADQQSRSRTVLVGYDADFKLGSRVLGPRVGRLVEGRLAGAVPESSLPHWSTSPRFVGPRALLGAMNTRCFLGAQGANYCEWTGIAHDSLAHFLLDLANAIAHFFSEEGAAFVTLNEEWADPEKWGPLPVLCVLSPVEIDLFELAEQPEMTGISIVTSSNVDEYPAATAYVAMPKALARLTSSRKLVPRLEGRLIAVGADDSAGSFVPQTNRLNVPGPIAADGAALTISSLARALASLVHQLHRSGPTTASAEK